MNREFLTIRTKADMARMPEFYDGVLVPTMGALHEGHATLIRHAKERADATRPRPPVVVTIFVNPTQFNDPADLARYPRTPETDLALCKAAGADGVFMPDLELVYPPDASTPAPPLPPVATQPGLEDALRPGHFAGVCQVVSRLFKLTRPDTACFGEKDWQQLRVISAMVEAQDDRDVVVPVIDPVPTVREPDGLAMSSRNRFLGPDDRIRARAVPRALQAAKSFKSPADAEAAMRRELEAAGLGVEYAVVRDAATLLAPGPGLRRALIAVRCGAVRLIDNAPVG